MSRRFQLPTDGDVVAVRDQLLTDAQAGGPRPTVVELGRRLGLTNTTFWRHYPAIARELADTERRDGPTATGADPGSGKNLSERAAALARDNQFLREHLDLAAGTIARLTLENHQLREALDTSSLSTPGNAIAESSEAIRPQPAGFS